MLYEKEFHLFFRFFLVRLQRIFYIFPVSFNSFCFVEILIYHTKCTDSGASTPYKYTFTEKFKRTVQ